MGCGHRKTQGQVLDSCPWLLGKDVSSLLTGGLTWLEKNPLYPTLATGLAQGQHSSLVSWHGQKEAAPNGSENHQEFQKRGGASMPVSHQQEG